MANDLNLGDLKITLETFEDAPVKATFDLPDGSTVARNFPQNGELVMRLGLGLGLNHRVLDAPPALEISGTPVLTATEDEAYAGFTVSATGGTEPYTFSIASGALPAGVTLNSSTGVVSGTPTESGTFAGIVIRVTDAALATDDLPAFTLEVEAAAAAPTHQFLQFTADTADLTTYTFNDVNIGDADASRVVLVCVFGRPSSGSSIVNAVTINGNAVSTLQASLTNAYPTAMATLAFPSGNTADIAVTWDTSQQECAICVYRLTGYSETPIDHISGALTNSSATLSMLIDAADGGVVIGMANQNGGAVNWTGLTEDAGSGITPRREVASQEFVSAATDHDIQMSAGGLRVIRARALSFAAT